MSEGTKVSSFGQVVSHEGSVATLDVPYFDTNFLIYEPILNYILRWAD